MPPNKWTPEEERLARELIDQGGVSEEEFKARVGRSKTSALSHFYYLKHGPRYNTPKRRYKRQVANGNGVLHGDSVLTHARPSKEMLEDAERRLLAPRTPTQFWLGDPPPGMSALDKRDAPCS